mmetsp:Transcript_16385/g.47062  ORF Transcript_16385/g.47062 Transcript_16385/m.47062 type:complete len:214 (-) Transcript_16385:238-879(-)
MYRIENSSIIKYNRSKYDLSSIHSVTAAVISQLPAHLATGSVVVTTTEESLPFSALERFLFHGQALGITTSAGLLLSLPAVGRCPTIPTPAVEGTEITTRVNSTYGLVRTATIAISRPALLCHFDAVKAFPREGCKPITTEEGGISEQVITIKVIATVATIFVVVIAHLSRGPGLLRARESLPLGFAVVGSRKGSSLATAFGECRDYILKAGF